MPDDATPRVTTTDYSPTVFLAPRFETARLSDLLGVGPGAGFLMLTGGTMSGAILYPGIPFNDLELVNKRYVDLLASGYVDAPNDGGYYGRWFGQWQPVLALSGGIMTGRMILAEDAVDLRSPVTLRQIAPLLGDFVNRAGDTMTGPLVLDADPVADMEAATKQYVDNATPIGAPFLPLAGGTMLGPLMLFRNPLLPMEAATALYVDTALGSYVALSGGPGAIMTGLLTLSGNPQVDAHATNKLYVDQQIASQALYQGTWQVQTNNPDLSNLVPPPLHGYSWIAVVIPSDAQAPAPPAMPGIGGMMMNNGDTVIWNDLLSTWERIVSPGLTRLQADALYVNLNGDTMTGGLRIVEGGTPHLTLSSSGQIVNADLLFGAANTPRWTLRKEATATGDLSLMAWNTAGTVASEVLHFTRVTGDMTLTGGSFFMTADGAGVTFASGALYKAFGVNQPLVVRLPVGNPMLRVEDSNGLNRRRILDEFIGVLKAGDTMQGPLLLFRDPVEDMEAITKQYFDAAIGAGPDFVLKAGDTMTGPLQVPNGTPALPGLGFGPVADGTGFSRAVNFLVMSVQSATVWAFTNNFTQTYQPLSLLNNRLLQVGDPIQAGDGLNLRTGDARYAPIAIATNAPFLPLAGGTMGGDIFLAFAPTQNMHAATKLYVDTAVATGSTYQGPWQVAANNPDLTQTLNTAGMRYLCRTVDPAVGEMPPVPIPGLTGRQIFDGDFIIWDEPLMQWDLLHAGGITKAEADTFYVQLAGSTMTGPLTLWGDPVNVLDAATKQYVDANSGGGGPGGGIPEPPPGSPPQGRTTSAGGGTSSWLPVLPLTGGLLSGQLQSVAAAPQIQLIAGGASSVQLFSQTGGSYDLRYEGNNGLFRIAYTSGGVPVTTDQIVIDQANRLITLTGNVAAPTPPAADNHLTNKAYVDGLVGTGVADYLPLVGGTLTGPLFLPAGPPPTVLAAATKQYVDNLVATVVGIAVFIGGMDASTPNAMCVFTALSGIPSPSPLPAANTVATGSHLIVTVAGMPTQGPVAGIAFDSGDWVISDGTAWFRLAFGGTNVVAAGVAVVPAVFNAFNVQTSLQNAEATLATRAQAVMKAGDTMTGDLNFASASPTRLLTWLGAGGVAPPTGTATRSIGTRAVLYPGGTTGDFGMGIESGTMWYSVPTANNHRWYCGPTQMLNVATGGLNLRSGTLAVDLGNFWMTQAGGAADGVNLRKNNRTVGQDAPWIIWRNQGGNSGGQLVQMKVHHLSNSPYSGGDGATFEVRVNDGYYGLNQQSMLLENYNVRFPGTVFCRTLNQSSDASLKQDVAPVDPDEADAAFAALNPVRFRWKPQMVADPLSVDGIMPAPRRDPQTLHWGFIAQDIEAGVPDLISSFGHGIDEKTYDLGAVVAILCAKIKQLEARLDGIR